MNRGEYFESLKWKAYLYLLRRLAWFSMYLNIPLKTKKSSTRWYKERFQQQIVDQMIKSKKFPFKWPIVLNLKFAISNHTAPNIQNLAKNYLDLLWKLEIPVHWRKSLLYKDDSQIKVLMVTRFHSEDIQEGLIIDAQPFRCFIRNLELYSSIDDEYKDHENYHITDYNDLNTNIRALEEFRKHRNDFLTKHSEQDYINMENHYKSDIQKILVWKSFFRLSSLIYLLFMQEYRLKSKKQMVME